MIALAAAQLHERRRSLLSWGLPIGLWSAFVVAIYPSVEDALSKAISSYPEALKQAFGIAELRDYIDELKAEIARVEADIDRKQGHRSAADAFFRRP